MDNGFTLRMNLNSKICLGNLHPAAQKRHAGERQQFCAAVSQSLRPIWPSRIQANLLIEKHNVGLVESMLLQSRDFSRVFAKQCGQRLHPANGRYE